MANLIPADAKRKIIKEYWLRVATVWLSLAAAAAVALTVACIPVYILISTEIAVMKNSDAADPFDADVARRAENDIKEANEIARILAGSRDVTPYSTYLRIVDGYAGSGVGVATVAVVKNGDKTTLTVGGVASSRTALADFTDALEADMHFATVTLPISNLTKDKDVPFSITTDIIK